MTIEMEPFLDATDIQGNIIPGFSRLQRYLVAFTCTDKARVQNVLALLHPHLTTTSEALVYRDERKRALLTKARVPRNHDLWVNVALGVGATKALGALEILDLDDEDGSFAQGMSPGLLGDPFSPALSDGSPNPSHRNHWRAGSPSSRIDILLIFAHDDDVVVAAQTIVDEVAAAVSAAPVYQEKGQVLVGEVEHFGFRDGISMPGIRGRILHDGSERLITTRYDVPSRNGIDFGKTSQPLAWPGQFLTGQPASSTDRPSVSPELRNGSFLVFRRLRQDVKAFFEDSNNLAHQISAETGDAVNASDFRAKIVGRFPSGASLMRHVQEPAMPEGPNEINYFEFGTALPALTLNDGKVVSGSVADPDVLRGRRCPVWAHTRKVNPRDQATNRGGEAETIGFQMLRRGIPFGPEYNHGEPDDPVNQEERGLLFLSYQRSIARQFSILNHDWMNNRDAPQAGGFDVLVGQNVPDDAGGLHRPKTATYFGSAPNTSGTDIVAPGQWVTPTGGAFLFAPSLTFVDKFSNPNGP